MQAEIRTQRKWQREKIWEKKHRRHEAEKHSYRDAKTKKTDIEKQEVKTSKRRKRNTDKNREKKEETETQQRQRQRKIIIQMQ